MAVYFTLATLQRNLTAQLLYALLQAQCGNIRSA